MVVQRSTLMVVNTSWVLVILVLAEMGCAQEPAMSPSSGGCDDTVSELTPCLSYIMGEIKFGLIGARVMGKEQLEDVVTPTSVIILRPPFVQPVPGSIAPPSLVLSDHPPDGTDEQGQVSDSKDSSLNIQTIHPQQTRLERPREEQLLQEHLMCRRAHAMVVPTNDSVIRARLWRLNEPVTLIGEREMERCDRLRTLMTKLD